MYRDIVKNTENFNDSITDDLFTVADSKSFLINSSSSSRKQTSRDIFLFYHKKQHVYKVESPHRVNSNE